MLWKNNGKTKILVIAGPTASGKTALSLALAEISGGEIVSCDSMQIYRGMDIGTAKPDGDERCGIRHYLIDIADIGESFSCADYVREADLAIAEIAAKGKLPIVCGGTGLYLDSLLGKNCFSPEGATKIREELNKKDKSELYSMLCEKDPESALAIHENNVKRVIRALEIYLSTGKTKSQWDAESKNAGDKYDAAIIIPFYSDRSALYERIDRRVDLMIKKGLFSEVSGLDLSSSPTASVAIGYKEVLACQRGEITEQEAVELIKKNSRNYAKRQLTWFARYTDAMRVEMDGEKTFEQIVNNIYLSLN